MGLSRWSDETYARHLEQFGPCLGPIYSALCSDVLSLHLKWLEYRDLYAASPERIDLLNDTAPGFFALLQDVLWDDVLLHVVRLTDPAHQGSNRNLTLCSLGPAVTDAALRNRVDDLVKQSVAAADFARLHRNKRLAHQDRRYALDRSTSLSFGSREQVEAVLALFARTLNEVSKGVVGSVMVYREIDGTAEARHLLNRLALAREIEGQRLGRLKDGTFTDDDLHFPEAP